jgi:hypothetical protein
MLSGSSASAVAKNDRDSNNAIYRTAMFSVAGWQVYKEMTGAYGGGASCADAAHLIIG